MKNTATSTNRWLQVYVVLAGFAIVGLILQWPSCAMAKSVGGDKSRATEKVSQKKAAKKHVTRKPKPVSRGIQAKAYYCVNPLNNKILLERNADQRLPVASLTKLVTALVVLDHMGLDRTVKVPDNIKTVPKSVVGLKPGDSVSVEDLLHGLLIGSGNDCAETLACGFPGGKDKLIQAMNKKVRKLGTSKTFFFTPSGLDRKSASDHGDKSNEDANFNVSTAREMAHIAEVAFSNRIIKSISLKKTHTMASALNKNSYPVRTTNKLLRDNLPVTGGKTGFTCRAGHCLASQFRPGPDKLLIVVLGSPDHFRDTRLVYKTALKKAGAPPSPAVRVDTRRVAAN